MARKNTKSKSASTHPELSERGSGSRSRSLCMTTAQSVLSPRHAIGYRLKGGSRDVYAEKERNRKPGKRQQELLRERSTVLQPLRHRQQKREEYIASRDPCLRRRLLSHYSRQSLFHLLDTDALSLIINECILLCYYQQIGILGTLNSCFNTCELIF